MTQIMMRMRKYDVIRAMTFLFGYTCCYVATGDLLNFLKVLLIRWAFPQWNVEPIHSLQFTEYSLHE
jgi:hypothetical protein